MISEKPYERVHFFNGFRTEAKDWQAIEAYHNGKRKLHNRMLHSTGIVRGLEVRAALEGTHYTVMPGLAIDGHGNEICLPEQSDPTELDAEKYGSGGTVYIHIRLKEDPIDDREVVGSSAPSEINAFFQENVVIEDSTTQPDNETSVELARIQLPDGWDNITNAMNPNHPRPGEIDMRYTLKAGASHHQCIAGSETVVENEEKPILIERIRFSEETPLPHRFYLASAHASEADKGKGPVSWRISSEIKNNHIEYYLVVKNESKSQGQLVHYQVRRIF